MSIDSKKLASIQDEDVLRRMCQETEDFAKKKEIRTHMYKLREARLKNFYSSEEITKEIQRTNSSPGLRTPPGAKSGAITHADSLADHSFLSLKTKEIRDSESPTRDMSYKISGVDANHQGWKVHHTNEKSEDGKIVSTSRVATTSGSEQIDKGVANYAAKNEMKATVFTDGDDKNFTKSVDASSKSVIKQEAHGGDENSKFSSTSTSTSSSSRTVTEHRSEEVVPALPISNIDTSACVSHKVYTENIPEEYKKHPSYVEGKTKVTTETKTLADGTIVKTTKYETRGDQRVVAKQQSSSTTSSSNQYSASSSMKSSSSTSENIREVSDTTDGVVIRRAAKDIFPVITESAVTSKVIQSEGSNVKDIKTQNISSVSSSSKNEATFSTNQTEEITSSNNLIESKGNLIQNESQTDQKLSSDIKEQSGRSHVQEQHHSEVKVHLEGTATDTQQINKEFTTNLQKEVVYSDQKIKQDASERLINIEKQDTVNKIVTTPKQDFVEIERKHIIETDVPLAEHPCTPVTEKPKYESPEKREPFKPGKSDFDEVLQPTEGQYDTTYRSDYTRKRISVDVSPTHDAFARSLRAVSPDRSSKCSSPSRGSMRTSSTSLRSSTSPEKVTDRKHHFSVSPESVRATSPIKTTYRKSPEKFSSNETITKGYGTYKKSTTVDKKASETNVEIDKKQTTTKAESYNSDTITRRKKLVNGVDATCKNIVQKTPTGRSVSSTSTASDFEYIKGTNEIVTDLDEDLTKTTTKTDYTFTQERPTSLDVTTTVTTKKYKKLTERSPTSPLPSPKKQSPSPTKEVITRGSSFKSSTKYVQEKEKPKDRPFKRSDTYEERCRQILGIDKVENSEKTTKVKSKLTQRESSDFITSKETTSVQDVQSQVRKSPEKPQLQEFPAQIRKSPEKEPLQKVPVKATSVCVALETENVSSQAKNSIHKETLDFIAQEQKHITETSVMLSPESEEKENFPEKQILQETPEICKPLKEKPSIQEFPSQIRKSPEKELLEPYPEKVKPAKTPSSIQEFPAQIRKSPEKETTDIHPVKGIPDICSPIKEGPKIQEFPSQIRRSPEKELLEIPEPKKSPTKEAPKIQEFPSQIRKSPEKTPCEKPPEKQKAVKEAPKIQEFPSQIRMSPEKIVCEKPLEKEKPIEEAPKIQEFPSQIRKSPEKVVCEKPQEKQKPVKEAPKIQEFPSQIRKSPERIVLEKPLEKEKPVKEAPKIEEFPSQIRKSPEKVVCEKPQEKQKPAKEAPKIEEFPSQIRKSPEKVVCETPLKKEKPVQVASKIQEFPSQIRKSPDKMICEKPFEKEKPIKETPKIQEFPSQIRKSPERKVPEKETSKTPAYSSPICQTPEKILTPKTQKPSKQSPVQPEQKSKPQKEAPKIQEFPSQIRRTPAKQPLEKPQEKTKPTKESPKIQEFPSQVRKQPQTFSKKDVIETRTPVQEPEFVKRTAYVCGPEEIDIFSTQSDNQHKTVKKDLSRKLETEALIEKERHPSVASTKTIEKKDSKIKIDVKKETTKNKTAVNGDIRKKTPTIERKPSKPDKLTAKTQNTVTELNFKNDKFSKSTHDTTRKTVCSKASSQTTTPKRHIVSTTITVTPKTKPETAIKKTPIQTVTTIKTTRIIHPKTTPITKTKKTKLQNGHAPSDSEESDVESSAELTLETSVDIKQKEEVNKKSKEAKCITTKSIIINNDVVTKERDIIVDLQRSKSSREGSPDRVCPLPVSSDEETGIPRYPDQISEPDDSTTRRKPKKLSDIPILETETLDEFTRIQEVKETDTSKVDLEQDECMLSVSDKVNKFINTAKQLTASQNIPDRPKSPRCQNYPEYKKDNSFSRFTDKITTFASTTDDVSKKTVTDTFIATEKRKCDIEKGPVSLAKIDITPKRPSPSRETILNRRASLKKVTPEKESPRRSVSPKESTPKSSRRPSNDESKSVLSSVSRLRSTESIRKAKEIFENINKEQEVLKQRDILSRPSVFQAKTRTPKTPFETAAKKEVIKKLDFSSAEEEITTTKKDTELKSTQEKQFSSYNKKTVGRERSPSPEKQKTTSRDSSTDRDIPGYMKPLDRSLRAHSPHRESIDTLKKTTKNTQAEESVTNTTTKFGVTLKRADVGKTVENDRCTTRTTVTEKIQVEIEDIFELKVLEEMLEKAVGYEIRSRIRAQIRLVKRLISENKLPKAGILKKERSKSPSQRNEKHYTEYQTKYTRKTSPERKKIDNKLFEHTDIISQKDTSEKTSEYQTSYKWSRRSSEEITTSSRSRSGSPPTKPAPTQQSFKPFQSSGLKKTTPVTNQKQEDKPEWLTQRSLKKVGDTKASAETKTSSFTSKKNQESYSKSTSCNKGTKDTDAVISSYGVGPLDENGAPLFGLRALRAQNKTDTTKVQGTVIRSQYYSENGQEPVGEVSVTKYSTDPKDLGSDEDLVKRGITSVTTTQKFGYKNTPSVKTITDSKKEDQEEDEIRTTKTTKTFSRRGSVKAISQKFIENAIETSKTERQSNYPKAGLILRTSSFKDASTADKEDTSSEYQESRKTVTTKSSSSSTRTGGSETFLTNKTKITGVQDVINRMTNEDTQVSDTAEDAEARILLNKFLGSQVLLSGMEGHISRPGGDATVKRRVTKVTTSITGNSGQPKTTTRIFQHPVTEEDLETVWDTQTLRLLLEQSQDYEERKLIRARLRQVMADQEASIEAVEKASEGETSGKIEGESLLLPLLQGLLDAPKCEQPADSGTESGDDLRGSLILEVQNALNKLSASLRSDVTDITPERRTSLLQLVTKLQAGLSTQVAPSAPSSERRNSGYGRFARRRTRQNRHTVGVSSEELADARRLMEEIALRDTSTSVTPSTSASRITPSTSASQCSILQKQNSEGSVGQKSPSSFRPVNIANRKPLVRNAVAKPFSNSTSGTSSSVETPTDPSEALHFLFSMDEPQFKPAQEPTFTETAQVQLRQKKQSPEGNRRSFSFDKEKTAAETAKRPISHAVSLDYSQEVDIKSVQQAVQQAAAIKKLERKATVSESTEEESETEEEDTSTVKQAQYKEDTESVNSSEFFPTPQPQPDLILQANPVYSRPLEDRQSKEASPEEKYNRFTSKKLRMKRANTIDIPKPLNFYECDDEEEEENSDYEHDQDEERRNNYLALRGPIHVGKLNTSKIVPTFQPRTDSDKKFMAFLNKHNENTANRNNIWCNKVHNWNNRFGNIRTTFEKVAQPEQGSTKNFWKSADDAVTAGSLSHQGPKLSKQSARNLQQMFEEKQKQNEQKKVPWLDSKHVVTGSLRVDTKGFERFNQQPQPQSPVRYNHLQQQPQSPINNFSHAPMSAFKPIEKKTPPPQAVVKPIAKPSALTITKSPITDKANSETPLYLYCPKPLYSPTDSQSSSPGISSKPFLQTGEKKLVNLAASKFEQAAQESQHYKPKNLGVSRGHISHNLQPQSPTTPERLSAPYLVKSAEQKGNVVRKLSNQYDHVGVTNDTKTTPQQFGSVAPSHQPTTRSNSMQKPHHYVPNITTTAAKRRPSQPLQHSHNYIPQYNHPQQFIQPTQTTTKPQMLKQKSLEKEQQYTSSFVYKVQKPQETSKPLQQNYQNQQKYQPTQKVQPYSESPKVNQQPISFDRQNSQDNYKEYNAAVAKVMTGPVSQQAVTVRQKSPMSRDEHEMERAFSLRSTLQKTTQHKNLSSGSFKTPYERQRNSRSPSPGPQQYRNDPRTPPSFSVNNQTFSRSFDHDDAVVTGKFHIPVVNVVPGTPTTAPTQAQVLSKSDSWHQICQQQQQYQSSPPQGSQNLRPVKSKSSHTLAVPKLFEAGMSKDEMVQKRQTVEAFFSGGKSPPSLSKSNSRENIEKDRKPAINRIKTSQKISIHKHQMIGGGMGISRSRTLPDIVCPEMLDESNVDKAFEELFKSKTVEEKLSKETETVKDVPVTTKQVTTRVTTQQVSKKPISPFAKFRQLDKQNSSGTPPSTPKTPLGTKPLFKFTDPAVSQSATTIKERLLRWCQIKTKEYENIQLDNFSTSWANGLAFCALIHHFVPDAFDYSALTPKERRHNFTLAFKVADEKAGIAPLLDVDDMVACRKPDWKCVFTYVQSIYRRFKDED